MRRVLFAVFVAVLGCMGAWFMVTTVSAGSGNRDVVLSATDTASAMRTVMLVAFSDGPGARDVITQVAQRPEMQALAGSHQFSFVSLPEGRCALCVGSFEGEDSPELARLLKEFTEYMDKGQRPFQQATVMPIAR